ncbi:hypothetical protein A6A08_20410 [Nocardiopsis sp. TSRI0078]|uniref:hypothetical protein n=1 Tax=unclassified Nocardiopsis TaxID=2649073 RepID=UPI00093FE355|nr:hypothetical protein [Nocardiopsis sp. TSRI0078]OKI21950.1 hypothetical protein A6A08_20410 [Nocardiopsis sp. TSRI0078]
MTAREDEQNGQDTVPPVTAHSIETVAGTPDVHDATSLLSCAAWTDASFRADVIRERVENPHRAPAREPGLEADVVVEECRRARDVRAAAGACFLGATLVLAPFNLTVSLIALLLTALLGLGARPRPTRGDGRARGNVLPWLVGTAVICFTWVYLFGLPDTPFMGAGDGVRTGGHGQPSGFAPGTGEGEAGSLLSFGPALLILLVVTVGIGYWVRARTNSTLGSIREHAERPGRSSGVGTVPVAFYNGSRPFVGAGVHYGSWPVTLELLPPGKDRPRTPEGPDGEAATVTAPSSDPGEQPGDDPAKKVPSMTGTALVEHLYAKLRTEIPGLTDTGGAPGATRHEVEVADCVFLPGLRQDGITDLAPALVDADRRTLREEWVSGLIGAFHERARHFLEIGIGMWEGQVVVTVFVRLSVQGGLLHIEGETMVMPPVSHAYRIPSGPLPTDMEPGDMPQLLWESFLGVVDDLRTNPAEAVAWLRSVHAVDRNRRRYDWAQEHGEFFDHSPRMGVRERSATRGLHQLFQSHDVRRVARGVQERVLSCVLDVLEETGYATEQAAHVIQNINTSYNSQVFGGQQNITGPNANVTGTTFDSPGHGMPGAEGTGMRARTGK